MNSLPAPVVFFHDNSPMEQPFIGQEVVSYTEVPGEIVILTDKQGRIIVRTITHTLIIHQKNIFRLLRKDEHLRHLYRIIMEKYQAAKQEDQRYLNNLSPADRYLKQLEAKAWLLQQNKLLITKTI